MLDGFKKIVKMKTGGYVAKAKEMCYGGKAMKKGGSVPAEDVSQDKKMVKKAFRMHDDQQHEEKTDLSKLKKGGRAKKEAGTVRKYKSGGSVTNVYEAKKSSGDLDNIQKTKDIKPGKAAAPSKAAAKPALRGSDVQKEKSKPAGSTKAKEVGERDTKAAAPSGAKGGPNKYKTGGGVKKFDDGGSVLGNIGTGISNAILGTPAQNAVARQNEAKYLRAKQLQQAAGKPMSPGENMAMGLAGLGQQMQPATTPTPATTPVGQKRGGRAGKRK
jgi:competence protein ComGC